MFDFARKDVRKTVYAKAELSELGTVTDDLVEKICTYLRGIFEIKVIGKMLVEDLSGISFVSALGYPVPLADMTGVRIGISSTRLGFLFAPALRSDIRRFAFFRFGVTGGYSLFMNAPSREPAFLHSVSICVPNEFFVEPVQHHVLKLGVSPRCTFEILNKQRLNEDPVLINDRCFGLAAIAGYEYWIGEKKGCAVGIETVFDTSFYDTLLMTISVNLEFAWRFYSFTESLKEEK